MNKDKLKKHHFWVLLGLVPLLVLIAVVSINSGVGAAIEEKQKAIQDAETQVKGKSNAKGNYLIDKMEQRVAGLSSKRTELWESNWKKQYPLFVWPKDKDNLLAKLNYDEKGNGLKFGSKDIPNAEGELDVFKRREVYLKTYEQMAERIAPTQFGNGAASAGLSPRGPGAFGGPGVLFGGGAPRAGEGWQSVLRHVTTPSGWGEQQPTPYQIWLAMEDIWVQRSMLEAVRAVNEQIATFEKKDLAAADGKAADNNNPLHRRFVSRLWDVELEVKRVDNKYTLGGKLTNNTDKLQLLGIGNVMELDVWLDRNATQPFHFKVGGEFVPGRGKMDIVYVSGDHDIPPGTTVTEIFKVEQVFDTRTVPVRRIDKLVLGYPDARNANKPPVKHKEFPEDPADTTAGQVPGAVPGGGRGGPPSAPPPSTSGPPRGASAEGPGAAGGVGAAGTVGAGWPVVYGAGTMESTLDATKKRYIESTTQVRRMPVAIAVIVDQSYLEDTLTAFANSPLRLQITQVHWQRFRGTLGEPTTGGGFAGAPGPGGAEAPLLSGGGVVGSAFQGSSGEERPVGPGPRPPRGGAAAGGAFVPPPGVLGPRPGQFGPPRGPGSEYPGGTGAATMSEGQLTSGLIELTIYGVVSLYEKYQPPPDASAGTNPPTATPPKP
jgi:hypothetical protein